MFRKTILAAAFAVTFSSSAFAQQLSRLELNPDQFETRQRVPHVDSLPSNYFADQSAPIAIDSVEADSSTLIQNVAVIFGFGTLLLTGGVITGFCVMKRRRVGQAKAPPVKLCV